MKKYLILIAYCGTFALQAQTAQEIITKHRMATGADIRDDIKSMHMSVTLENAGAGSIPMNMYIQRPDKVSIRMTFNGQELIMVQNGEESWMINPMIGNDPVPIPEAQKGQLTQALKDMDGQYADYLEHPENYEYIGMAELNGKSYHKINVLNQPQAEEVITFFDAETFYTTRQEIAIQGQLAINELSDYRVVSGIHIPFLINTSVGGTLANKMIINSLTINNPLDPAVFVKP